MRRGGFPTILVIFVVFGGFGALLVVNGERATPVSAVVPSSAPATPTVNALQDILRDGFGNSGTPLPTPAIPTAQFVPPTLISDAGSTPELVGAGVVGGDSQSQVATAVRPTLPPPTEVALVNQNGNDGGDAVDGGGNIQVEDVAHATTVWQPPALIPPLSRDPLGRDHYWFSRPIDSNGNSEPLFYYTYGSDGPYKENPYRVHHGLDMPNPIGVTVRAAGPGTVVWASDGLHVDEGYFQNSPSYGNVVAIRHDMGYQGHTLYTLYAHLSAALVKSGDHVEMGDAIGLVGNTGNVSGPHVHFEVRLGDIVDGEDVFPYRSSYNPILWMVPFVGTGVIAGRVVDERGNVIDDADVTIRSWATGLIQTTTTTYVYTDSGSDVNADPLWRENFAVTDIPVGRYQVIAEINGIRVAQLVDVQEGMTNWVDLKPPERPTATPTPNGG